MGVFHYWKVVVARKEPQHLVSSSLLLATMLDWLSEKAVTCLYYSASICFHEAVAWSVMFGSDSLM